MTPPVREANRLNWIVKGCLLPPNITEQECIRVIESYTRRLWNNNEAYICEEDFEKEWEKRVYGANNVR